MKCSVNVCVDLHASVLTLSCVNHQRYYSFITLPMADLKYSVTFGFSKKFAIKSLSFRHHTLPNYVGTLYCEM